ncbi:MAG: extensin family protein [Beijerinckiaceae bacterium]
MTRSFKVLALAVYVPIACVTLVQAEPTPGTTPGETCVTRLAKSGVVAKAASLPARPADPACTIMEPVQLLSTPDAGLPARRIRFPDEPVLSCAMAERFSRFTSDIVAPLALGIHGKELVAISTGPGFECRPRNRQAGAKLSSHGQGNAVDIMALELHGARKIVIERPDGAESARLINAIRAAACGSFTTVLGPGADAAHANHIHIDIEARGRDGRSKFCQ